MKNTSKVSFSNKTQSSKSDPHKSNKTALAFGVNVTNDAISTV